ncbi:hypothetical protein AB0903_33570 [Streptomyces sp. NPDC048389]|uniref:hypothetical protein n=1 Tax=Streptomyces sp. NPDC048389 TaxID=3154622 RepID=UPI00345450B9
MPFLSAPAAEPRHSSGGAGGARRGQWVKYPLRVVTDAEAYAPGDTNFYGKVKALSKGRRATASMEKMAGYLDWSKSTGERAGRRLGRPAPTDGVVELFTKRNTHKITGTGQTAERWCRDLDKGEPFVWGPVLAADTLRGLLHRLYLGLRYATVIKHHQPTLAELAQLLRHHGGKRAGQPLAEASVSRLLDELEALGWITVDRRAGYRGRHAITVHDHPVHPVDEPEPTPDPGDGSGPDLGDGSLAYKEDQGLNDLEKTRAGGSIRRRRDTGSRAVDTFGNPIAPPPYTGPQLTLSPRIWHVLEPVRHLLPGISPYLMRRIAREIGHQLDTYATPQRLRARLTARTASAMADDIRDPGRWLLGAALPRWGCGLADCETGVLWTTGHHCHVCADIRADRRTGHPPHPPPHTAPEPALDPTGT